MKGGFIKNKRQIFFVSLFISILIPTFSIVKKIEAKTPDYAALRVEQSYPGIIKLEAGKSITFWVKFKNVGAKSWLKDKVSLKTASNQESMLAHPLWLTRTTPYAVKYGVPVKTIGTFKFALKAPAINNLYWEKFQLYVNGQKIPGGEIEIGLNVYGGKNPEPPPPPPIINEQPAPAPSPVVSERYWEIIPADYTIAEEIKITEPNIRVGLFYENSQKPYVYLPIKIRTADHQPYQVKLLNENLVLLTQTHGEETEINFDFQTKKYFINVDGQRVAQTDSPIRFGPLLPETKLIFKITSWLRGPTFWGAPCNDNEYRGELEIKYNPKSDRLWMINELPIEDYMKGVAEVQDYYPEQALKAQKIAARTYAYTRILIPKYTNVNDEDLPLFDLRATQADQVYRGYLWEVRSPNIKKAAEETRGMVAIYGDAPILAYYFARTDGRTRSSCEAKMTKECMPYLVAVDDPPGIGKTLLGHGVGMPQQSARVAADGGATFQQILRYYYRNIDIKKIW